MTGRLQLKAGPMTPSPRRITALLGATILSATLLVACGAATPDAPGADENNPTNNTPNNTDLNNTDPNNTDPNNNDPATFEPPGEVRQGTLSREETPAVDEATRTELSAGNQNMAFELFATL